MEYRSHVWTGNSKRSLDFLDMFQNQVCKVVGPSLADSLELLVHNRDVASLNLEGNPLNLLSQFLFLPLSCSVD